MTDPTTEAIRLQRSVELHAQNLKAAQHGGRQYGSALDKEPLPANVPDAID